MTARDVEILGLTAAASVITSAHRAALDAETRLVARLLALLPADTVFAAWQGDRPTLWRAEGAADGVPTLHPLDPEHPAVEILTDLAVSLTALGLTRTWFGDRLDSGAAWIAPVDPDPVDVPITPARTLRLVRPNEDPS